MGSVAISLGLDLELTFSHVHNIVLKSLIFEFILVGLMRNLTNGMDIFEGNNCELLPF